MCKKLFLFVIFISCFLIFIHPVYAHPGRTDSNGGHKDANNVSGLGPYHYHCGGNPAHLHPNGVCPYAGGGGSAASTPKVTISVSNMPSTMNVGDSALLIWSVSDNSSVSWESSDSSILSFSDNGRMSALKEGKVTVTATTAGTSKAFTVDVKPVPADSITLSDAPEQIKVGESKTISAAVLPSNTTDKTINWTSSDERVATVNNGEMKGISAGTVKIMAQCQDAAASVEITVIKKGFPFAGAASVTAAAGGGTYIFRRIKRKKLKNQSIEDNHLIKEDDTNDLNEAYIDINFSGSYEEDEQEHNKYQ